MAYTSTAPSASDNNQMILGIAGLTAEGMAKQVAALLAAELALYGVLALQNNNLTGESEGQAAASKAGFDSQSTADKWSAIAQGFGAVTQVAGVATGAYQANKVQSDIDANNTTIEKCNTNEKEIEGREVAVEMKRIPAYADKASAEEEEPISDPKTIGPKQKIEALAKIAEERKTAQEQLKTNSERQSGITQRYQRMADTGVTCTQALDKVNASIQATQQGIAKRNEILAQTAVTLNGSTTQGLEKQQQAYSSDIAATIAAEGSQGLAGQASMHKV